MPNKWSDTVLIVISDCDIAIELSVKHIVLKYGVESAFYLDTLEEESRNKFKKDHLNPLITGCLRPFNDSHLKIILLGHGTGGFESSPERLIVLLHQAGLRQCGLISFKGCSVGCGDFLDRFVRKCFELDLIQVGFVLGYTGNSASPLIYTPCSHETVGCFHYFLNYVFFFGCFFCGPFQLPDSFRVKVVRGNHNIVPLCGPTRRFPAHTVRTDNYPATTEPVHETAPLLG